MACAHELRNAREPFKKTVCTHRCSYDYIFPKNAFKCLNINVHVLLFCLVCKCDLYL